MSGSSILIESHFLPSIEYLCALGNCDVIILEKNENFIKQSYRNRTFVLTSQGAVRLTIPLVANHKKVLISDIEIDYTTRWQVSMWRTLESSYARSPFFEHYADDVKKLLLSGEANLFEFNRKFLSMCLQWLRWSKVLSETVTYDEHPPNGIVDLRNAISAKKGFLEREIYRPVAYQQVFGSNFAPNLGVLDLIFCEGPASAALVKASQKRDLNK